MQRVLGGVAGGILGALVFGVVLQATGAMTMLGTLVDWPEAYIGWIVHLTVGAILGFVYAVTVGLLARGWLSGALTGLVYGAVAWVVGWRLVLPTLVEVPSLDAGSQAFAAPGDQAVATLGGHLLYGLVLGLALVAAVVGSRRSS